MRTFIDNAGRTWTVAINVNALKRVRDLANVDLMGLFEGRLIERLVGDPILLCDVVYAICKPEADARGISDEDFGRAMAGDTIEHATKALLEGIIDFFPNPRDRANLQRAWAMMQTAMDKMRDTIEARMDAITPESLAAHALTKCGPLSGDVPESSASTPGS